MDVRIITSPRIAANYARQMAEAHRNLGECAWTLRTDNTFGQPNIIR